MQSFESHHEISSKPPNSELIEAKEVKALCVR
jgi:hypothetical protein